MCNQAPPLSFKDGNRVHRRAKPSSIGKKRRELEKRNKAYDGFYGLLTDKQKEFTGPFEFNYSGLTKKQARKANKGLNANAVPFYPPASRPQFFQPPVNGYGPFQMPPQNQYLPQTVNGYGLQQPFQMSPRNQPPQHFQQPVYGYGPQPPFQLPPLQLPPQNHTSSFGCGPSHNFGNPAPLGVTHRVSRPPMYRSTISRTTPQFLDSSPFGF